MTEHVRRMRCPECDTELVIRAIDPVDARGRGWPMEFPIYAADKRIGTFRCHVLLSGCAHADAWNRGPDGDGGEPLPLEHCGSADYFSEAA